MHHLKLNRMYILLSTFLILFGSLYLNNSQKSSSTGFVAAVDFNPTDTVVLAGNFQNQVGCSQDWQPDCLKTKLNLPLAGDSIFRITLKLRPGTYELKIALNRNWNVNFGQEGVLNGVNYKFRLTSARSVTFFWDATSKLVYHNALNPMYSIMGDFQILIGCKANHDPNCLLTLLKPLYGPNIESKFVESTVLDGLPAGKYGGILIQDGMSMVPNKQIAFTISEINQRKPITFLFDGTDLSVEINGGHCNDHPGASDGCIVSSNLKHDTRNETFKSPFGPIPLQTSFTLRFQTRHKNVQEVKFKSYFGDNWEEHAEKFVSIPMNKKYESIICDHGDPRFTCDLWEIELRATHIGILSYYFHPIDGTASGVVYGDDKNFDNGLGVTSRKVPEKPFTVIFYDPAFGDRASPDWSKDGIVYHIYPDRFRNGDISNDIKTGELPRYTWKGTSNSECRQNINKCGDPKQKMLQVSNWNSMPESYCRAYDPAECDTANMSINRDFFGGDLEGIIQKLDYLKSLGVTIMYLNPIFDASSNHLYDTRDYMKIAPWFGDLNVWKRLVKEASNHGMKIVLDGVFNHVSSDSPYFNQYGNFDSLGACQSLQSPYRNWFLFEEDPQMTGKAPCAGPKGHNTMYATSFLGYETLPTLNKANPEVLNLVVDPSLYWIDQGAVGWRLDAMFSGTYDQKWWPNYRQKLIGQSKERLLIGEAWGKEEALSLLYGNKADAVTNYRFRYAIQALLIPLGNKGSVGESPKEFANRMMAIREDYTDTTYFNNWNILDSHDSRRILWELTPGRSNKQEKEISSTNVIIGKQLLKLAFVIQYTVPGNPLIYYGNEVGVTGDNDPDDRRSFPWKDLNGNYQKQGNDDFGQGGDFDLYYVSVQLAKLRKQYPVFMNAKKPEFLVTNDEQKTLGYLLRNDQQMVLVLINRHNEQAQPIQVPFPEGILPEEAKWKEIFSLENKRFSASRVVAATATRLTVPVGPLQARMFVLENHLSYPRTPSNIIVHKADKDGTISINWKSHIENVSKYNILRSDVRGGLYTLIGSVEHQGQFRSRLYHYIDSKAVSGKRYFYKVVAVGGTGMMSQMIEEHSYA